MEHYNEREKPHLALGYIKVKAEEDKKKKKKNPCCITCYQNLKTGL